ncbi:hypothetical protein VPHD51_0012 [Vibrio phage D51]
MTALNIASLVLDHKSMEFPFSDDDGFIVELTYTTAEKYAEIRKECATTKLDPQSGYPVETIDQEKWNTEFCKQTITGWKGLTYGTLATLMLIDESKIEDLDAEVEYTVDNAELLLKHSKVFDQWVNSRISNLQLFRD